MSKKYSDYKIVLEILAFNPRTYTYIYGLFQTTLLVLADVICEHSPRYFELQEKEGFKREKKMLHNM